MASFSSLVGFPVSDFEALTHLLQVGEPPQGHPLPYKAARLLKPTKGSKESRWQLVWWQFSVPDGKIIRRRQSFDLNSITSLKDRGQRAAAWLVAINGMLQKGYVYVGEVQAPVVVVELKPADRLLLDVFAAFLKTKEKLSQGSYDVHKAILDLLARWCKDNKLVTLADLTKEQGQKFLEYLAAYVSPKTKRVLSPKSFNNYGLNLKTFGNWLTEQGWLKRKHHPFQAMKKTKTGNGEKHTPYTQAQLTAILNLAEADPQFYLFLHFLYYTFARPGKEVRLLRVKDLRESTIWISQAHDKNDRGRYCDIPTHLQELITKAGIKAGSPHDFVFGSKGVPGEEPRGKKYFYKKMRKVLAQLGLADQGYDLYGMKHSGNIEVVG